MKHCVVINRHLSPFGICQVSEIIRLMVMFIICDLSQLLKLVLLNCLLLFFNHLKE